MTTDQTTATDQLLDTVLPGATDEEHEMLCAHFIGATVTANMSKHGHPRLIAWAKTEGVFTRIDRASKWGNPYVIPGDGNRDQVIARYAHHLDQHPDLDPTELTGRILGCWCTPERCHGHILADRADR